MVRIWGNVSVCFVDVLHIDLIVLTTEEEPERRIFFCWYFREFCVAIAASSVMISTIPKMNFFVTVFSMALGMDWFEPVNLKHSITLCRSFYLERVFNRSNASFQYCFKIVDIGRHIERKIETVSERCVHEDQWKHQISLRHLNDHHFTSQLC